MKVEMPKYEHIMQPEKDLLNGNQKLWYELLCLTSDTVHNAMIGFVDNFTGNYHQFRLSDFFTALNGVAEGYADEGCANKLLADDFVLTAYLAEKALKHIVAAPSTKIIKVDTKVQANKLRNSSIKTMNYLAKRSGQTVKEKIAPENKVLTTLTRFTPDTLENRHSLYLLDVLYNMLAERYEDSPCKTCKRKDRECYKISERIRSLLHLKTEIRKSELYGVKKERQRIQNNKLMCDKYYKLVWDCVKLLESSKGKIESSWDLLCERYETLTVWFVIARLLSYGNVRIKDRIEKLTDDGNIRFENSNDVTLIAEEGSCVKELTFRKTDGGYVCDIESFRINSSAKPTVQHKRISADDLVEEYFMKRKEGEREYQR